MAGRPSAAGGPSACASHCAASPGCCCCCCCCWGCCGGVECSHSCVCGSAPSSSALQWWCNTRHGCQIVLSILGQLGSIGWSSLSTSVDMIEIRLTHTHRENSASSAAEDGGPSTSGASAAPVAAVADLRGRPRRPFIGGAAGCALLLDPALASDRCCCCCCCCGAACDGGSGSSEGRCRPSSACTRKRGLVMQKLPDIVIPVQYKQGLCYHR